MHEREKLSQYLFGQIKQHARFFFEEKAVNCLKKTPVHFVPYREAVNLKKNGVAIPTDIPYREDCDDLWQVPFNDTTITLWNRLPEPETGRWRSLPSKEEPVWYQNETGNLIPAWNLYANLVFLLTFQEERKIKTKDQHGRFTGRASPREKAGLLKVPAFNEAVALLIAACRQLNHTDTSLFNLETLVKKPVLILSHDVDKLHGNDFWTQSARMQRLLAPLAKGKPPAVENLKWIWQNAFSPKNYCFNNLTRLVQTEKNYGFHSSFYFINGRKGRFGARNGNNFLNEAVQQIPPEWNIGIHYNYDASRNRKILNRQLKDFIRISGKRPNSGRAHYLIFDPDVSFSILRKQGIMYDESAGYPDRNGLRCGIAAPFKPYDEKQQNPFPLWEMPLLFMDTNLMKEHSNPKDEEIYSMILHLKKIGGAVSILFHPEYFDNPEYPRAIGLYKKILNTAKSLDCEGCDLPSFIKKQRLT